MTDRQYAHANTDINGLTDRLKPILEAAWGKDWGKFTAEMPKYNDHEAPMPQITYVQVSRKPSKSIKNIKPVLYNTYPDPDNPGYTISEYRQRYDCILDFVCWDKTSSGAMSRAEQLEEFIFTYTGIFKNLGIAEIVFIEMTKPEVNTRYRQDIPYVAIRYGIQLERIHERRSYAIRILEQQIEVLNPSTGESTIAYPPSLNEERDIILNNIY